MAEIGNVTVKVDAVIPIDQSAQREPIAAILNHSAVLGIEVE